MDIGLQLEHDNPNARANVFSKAFFGWMIKTVYKGSRETLQLNDLYKPLERDGSTKLGDKLEENWRNEVARSKKTNSKPSFLKAILRTFSVEFMLYGILVFILNVPVWCSQPLILGQLVSYFGEPYSEENQQYMYMNGALLVVCSGCVIFLYHHSNFGLSIIGMRIRTACSALVYRKITRLNQKALAKTAAGQVVNILSNDVNRFDLVMFPLHTLWIMPFQVLYLSFIIWRQVGISALAGILTMAAVALPFQGYLGNVMGNYRARISKKTDTRVRLMDEIISGIQVIKMYAWEKPFEKVVELARRTEIKDIKASSYMRGIYSSCMIFLDKLALFSSVICYVLLGNIISPEKVFSLAQAFNILQLSMAIWYPLAISLGAETLISVKRLQDFLLLEEMEDDSIMELTKNCALSDINCLRSLTEMKTKPSDTNIAKKKEVILSDVDVSWTEAGATLKDITLHIPAGTLCAVVGPVGAGKSTLLQFLLGELLPTSGKIQIEGELSYSSQNAWIFQSTVRNNIIFGKPYSNSLYKEVIRVCALERDFEQFPLGDQTIVGERGVSLSGGQRARINLARAVYRDADIYLLDDPLSAVDTHVGRHLFDECIRKYLAGKIRILVTHQLHYLKKADLIVVINNGRIEAQGTFKQLSESKLDFTKLLVDIEEEGEKKEKEKSGTEITSSVCSIFGRKDSKKTSENPCEQDREEEESRSDPNSKPFKDYILATKNIWIVLFLVFLMILAQALCAGADLWVAFWTTQESVRHSKNAIILAHPTGTSSSSNSSTIYEDSVNRTISEPSSTFDGIFDDIQIDNVQHKLIKTNYAIYFYSAIIGTAVFLTFGRSFLFYKTCMLSSVNLHSKMFHALLKAPMRFFDTNPSGRVLNRFSKDMGAIDEVLPRVLLEALSILLVMFGLLVNVSISNPYIIIAIFVLGVVFWKMRGWYISSARAIKHLEGITKSPVFSHVNSTLNGIITIRANKAEEILMKEFDGHQDVHSGSWYLLMGCMCSFGLWLDLICVLFTVVVTFSFIILNGVNAVNASLVGLAIYQSMILTSMLQHGMRQLAEVVNQFTSIERVLQYTTIEQEGPFETPKDEELKDQWPKGGSIEFKNLSLRYIKNDPPVLKNLNFTIYSGQKVGIVGRTGAGKSSLIAALFRLSPLDGYIFIDDIETHVLGLTELRKKISIIPQEPVLFSATLRYNLDPFKEFNDDQIWKALEQVELKDCVDTLDFEVAEGGANFSLGQKQLVCLARAILRNNKILILDEATANVDPRTDSFIQNTIRERFRDCTVLTIAHRLNTIMDSDKVLVMSYGKMVEFDHPHVLLQKPDGYFHNMVLETGPVMSSQLKEVASDAYSKSAKSIV